MTISLQQKSFFDTYAEAVLITDKSQNVLYTNPAFEKLTGFCADKVSLIGTEKYFKLKVNLHTVLGSPCTTWETGLETSAGNTIWVKVSVSPIELTDSTGKIFTCSSNPSLEQVNVLLKESETRFSTLADSSPAMIWITDTNNLCYYLNKAWLNFRGRKLEEELGVGWLQGVHPDDLKVFDNLSEQLKQQQSYTCEYRLLRHDGVFRYLLEIGTPRCLPDGTFTGYMGSCIDVTEMREAQIELAAQTKELIRSNEELEQFAYVASHDMQEPLRMIASYVQLIQKNLEAGNTKGVVEFMNFVLDGVNRMQALISDLLQFSRVNKKGSPFVPIELNEVMNIVSTHLTNRIKENNATVLFDEMPTINGDSFQIIRLFQNLIDNAIKFKSPYREPVIRISVKEEDVYYKFSVCDNGIGIDNKFYNRIFVIFQRLHTRNEFQGTGIGLAVCKKIVERHGGDIWVESELDKGTTFFFTIKK